MEVYYFGPFQLDEDARRLSRLGEPVPLTAKVFDTLSVLVRNHGRVLDKEELLSAIWPGTTVEEANLAQNVFTLRKVLGDNAKDARYIATIPGR
jgi:DNA-binding winged helix-turn-helix (wHTH) protein